MDNLNEKLSDEAQNQPSCLGAVSSNYICPECNTAHKVSELVMADNGWDYSYYCKSCGELLESNGVYYGK